MASAFAIAPSFFIYHGNKNYFNNLQKLPVPSVTGRRNFLTVVAKAVGDSSDSSSQSIVKYVQSAWNNSEDRIALAGFGFAAIVAVWASANLIGAIDKLPVIPSAFEFIGILFSWGGAVQNHKEFNLRYNWPVNSCKSMKERGKELQRINSKLISWRF